MKLTTYNSLRQNLLLK